MRGVGTRDFDIHREILCELDWEPGVVSTQVGVQVDRGIVTLLGNVSSLQMRDAAELAARRVEGVRAVVNALVIHVPECDGPDQVDVARAVATALLVPGGDDCFEIVLDGSYVILEGCVASKQESQRIEETVRLLATNHRVVNRLAITNSFPDAALIHRAIQEALVQQATCDARFISVDVDDCTVLLRGTVRDAGVRDQAARAAFVTGVQEVLNRLELERHLIHEKPQGLAYPPAVAHVSHG